MLTTKIIESKKTWENFLLSSSQASFLQSWNWGEFHRSLGKRIFRLGFYQNNKLVGLSLLVKVKAKRGTYLECPGGPVIDWNKDNFQKTIRLIKSLAKQENAIFIRIRPNTKSSSENLITVKSLGLIKSPMHLHAESTWVLSLKKSEEELLKDMRKNTRYSVKKAQKLGVKVSQSVNPKDIKVLHSLQLATVKRKRFSPFTKDYFSKQLQAFKQDNQIKLFKASYKNKILAISFIIFYGNEAVYHYSGSSSKMRHIPASYLLQWEAIKEAKKRNLNHYNFWGYTDNPRHRFFGPSLFKKGFGGQPLNYLPAHDLPLSLLYWPIYAFETLRRKFRHL